MKEHIITAIDIGTTKFFGLVGLVRETGIEIIASEVKKTEEDWIKDGRIGYKDGVVNGLVELLDSLREQSKEEIKWITVGVGGGHIFGKVYSKKIEILPKGRPINEGDVQLLEREIKNIISSENSGKRDIIYIIPQEFIIDDNPISVGRMPFGMYGDTLEMRAHVLTGESNPIKNINECAKMAGVKLSPEIFPYSWAVAEAVVNEEEKKSGCLIIDFGKSTTDIVLYSEGKIILTDSIKVGSFHINYDLATKYHISFELAEDLKIKYAWCDYKKRFADKRKEEIETVEIFNPKGKSLGKVSTEEISKIVYWRVQHIFEDLILKNRLMKTMYFPTRVSEVIISGGGAKLKGIVKLAEDIFQLPARIGIPQKLMNLDKSYQKTEFSAGIGLLLLASKVIKTEDEPFFYRIKKWFKRWLY
ncbi:MAG: cell division protein FtsA [Candidatus Omnitrophica bacterium]|nr:cell division protein FtsA [Candidatus Omnitrophota bacterium]MCM8801827.1 cell division protein FtsA [Candidatus Omnitrophota bacterium]